MRTIAGLFLTVSLFSAPAFAQELGGESATQATTVTLSGASVSSRSDATPERGGITFGFLDRLTVNRAPQRPVAAIAPFDTDQLTLAWRPGTKWGITLDLTSRSDNDVLPREELSAGAYYQITPRFRFGGGLTLNGDSIKGAAEGWREENGEAGVRVESAFSF